MERYLHKQGTASVTTGAKTANLIASAGTSAVIRVIAATITVTTAATGGGGIVTLRDGTGGTVIFTGNAAALGNFQIYFGEDGFALTAGNALSLEVSAAVTNDASCSAAATSICPGA